MNKILTTASLLLLAASAGAQNASFQRTQLSAGINLIHAEVAKSDAQRQQGLMYRKQMGQNDGMVFVFDDINPQCMWMKNTWIALSVAFIDAEGKIVNIEDMEPQTLESHCSAQPVKFALEMNQGWFARRGIKPGMKIDGLVAPQAQR